MSKKKESINITNKEKGINTKIADKDTDRFIKQTVQDLIDVFSIETEENFIKLISFLAEKWWYNCSCNKASEKEQCKLTIENFIAKNPIKSKLYKQFLLNTNEILRLTENIFSPISCGTSKIMQVKYCTISDIDFINRNIISKILDNKYLPKSLKLERIIQVLEDKSTNIFWYHSPIDRDIQKKINTSFLFPLIKKDKDKTHIILPIKNPLNRLKWVLHFSLNKEDYDKNKIRNLLKLWKDINIISILSDSITNRQIYNFHFDYLTWAFSRNVFEQKVSQLLEQITRDWVNISFLLLDIDYFKKVNDTYWHHIWDIILKDLVQSIKKNIRSTDIVWRLWWEEFGIIFNHHNKKIDTDIIYKKLKKIIVDINKQKPTFINEPITISVGGLINLKNFKIFFEKDKKLGFKNLYTILDKLLYRSKNFWRNQITFAENPDKITSIKFLDNVHYQENMIHHSKKDENLLSLL